MAWPALQEFKESTIWHIAQQPKHVLGVTGLNQCGRLIGELSPHWMTPDEKAWFDAQWKVIFDYAPAATQTAPLMATQTAPPGRGELTH